MRNVPPGIHSISSRIPAAGTIIAEESIVTPVSLHRQCIDLHADVASAKLHIGEVWEMDDCPKVQIRPTDK